MTNGIGGLGLFGFDDWNDGATDKTWKRTSKLALRRQRRRGNKTGSSDTMARGTNRRFFGLIQVCSQLRNKHRLVYLAKRDGSPRRRVDLTSSLAHPRPADEDRNRFANPCLR